MAIWAFPTEDNPPTPTKFKTRNNGVPGKGAQPSRESLGPHRAQIQPQGLTVHALALKLPCDSWTAGQWTRVDEEGEQAGE